MSDISSSKGGGYGRPPIASQFKPGQSGNPKGRPKGSKNLTTLIHEELEQKIPLEWEGRIQRISKRQVAVRHLVHSALKGDLKAFALLVKLEGQGQVGDDPAAAKVVHPQSEIPLAAYEDILASLRGGSSTHGEEAEHD